MANTDVNTIKNDHCFRFIFYALPPSSHPFTTTSTITYTYTVTYTLTGCIHINDLPIPILLTLYYY